jgi:hypothetical protein
MAEACIRWQYGICLSRMIIGARNLWLTLVIFNKNSLPRKIFVVFGAVEILTATITVPS